MVRTRAQSLLAPISQTSSHQHLPQNRRRKRKQSTENAPEPGPGPAPKQPRRRKHPTENAPEPEPDPSPASDQERKHVDPIAFWAERGHWPEEQDWPEDTSEMESPRGRPLARKKPSPPLSRKRSNSTITGITNSTPGPREEKSVPYQGRLFEVLLETKRSYLREDPLGLASANKDLLRSLLETPQPIPSDTLFRDDIFKITCLDLHDKNEARVIQDIARLIVPSAATLSKFGAKHLDILTETVNEGWKHSIPLANPRPQPDYAVGFKRQAFTEDQLNKLSPFIGNIFDGDQSLFLSTHYMYFPFLTCEVKCGSGVFEVADRQNAHSMTLAVRAIVELFRYIKREDEVNRQILAFSVSHNEKWVSIYGHYPVINGQENEYYRYPIQEFNFTALDGKDKWTSYRIIRNIYDIWMPAHYKKICSAIDQLPAELDLAVPPLSGATGLSQDAGSLMSEADPASKSVEQDSRSSNAGQQGITPDTSLTRPEAAKRRKRQV
ncbi:hypothetical protein NEUTE1DRAFT_129250 [Neurospora tetrasperma FGSC 2508]|uniref:DUF7924 domain-containing protein n=1 Tax=Neurospora tetrasperma (strain FGSC 2508 / ATCC MYA-4615 / P0657) TaxID=510951 RepID=F8MN38_NEUT8|nr:uncharacterized protein NEUTE1DRAFT_129250 [Neurospora tetrasperma FGSC 2508]EGO57211.1 hypothetical protein NEUTE1DRAFT_129250 [Neurospora tetrasperma FGSC 2508]EGZ72544.1 hypothetical protein NEUTE2DRAFT_150881 [Neurospora tetrasperma FGSC 2509]